MVPVMDSDIERPWFEADSGIFDGLIDDPGGFPLLDDRLAPREWLAGFAGGLGRAGDRSARSSLDGWRPRVSAQRPIRRYFERGGSRANRPDPVAGVSGVNADPPGIAPVWMRFQRRGSTGSLSRASTPKTHSCTR